MKKQLLVLLLSVLAVVQLPAQEPVALWGKAMQAGYQARSNSVSIAPDDGIYSIASVGTRFATDDICFGSDKIAPGTENKADNGNSYNGNFVLTRINKTGSVLWAVYSKNADVMANNMYVQTVRDGVVAFFGVRHAEKYGSNNIVFVDAANKENVLEWTLDDYGDGKEHRYYMGVVLKVNADGQVQWLRKIEASHAPQPAGTAEQALLTAQGINPCALQTDARGDIFIAGGQATELKLLKQDGTYAAVAPRYVDGWDGKSISDVGDLFLIKLNAEGYYLNHVQTAGTATKLQIVDMDYKNGKITLLGTLKGVAGQTVSLGGKAVTPADAYAGVFTARMDSNFNTDYFTFLPSQNNKNFTLNTSSVLAGKEFTWVLCKCSGELLTTDGKTVSTGKLTRAGMVMKLDKKTGALLQAYVRNEDQSGFFSSFEGEDGCLYAFGHKLLGNLWIDKFTPADITAPASSWNEMIVNTSDALDIAFTRDGLLFTSTTANAKGNKLYGGTLTIDQTSTAYSCNICAFQLPVKPYIPVAQGDANGDGVVSVADAVAIVDYMTGKPSASFVEEAADMNGDGKIDVSDVVALISLIVG